MLGTGALGQLALGQENTTRFLALSASGFVRINSNATVYASAALRAQSLAKAGAVKASPTLWIEARGKAVAHMRAPAGLGLPTTLGGRATGQILPGIAIQSTGRAVAYSFATIEIVKAGAGKLPGFPSYIPQPDYAAKPAKPFRPIWDRRANKQTDDETSTQADRGPPPMPPAALFGTPEVTVNLRSLPDYGAVVPGEWHDIGVRAQAALEQRDVDDAMAILESIADEALLAAIQSAGTRKN
jgi:hypothetical protein